MHEADFVFQCKTTHHYTLEEKKSDMTFYLHECKFSLKRHITSMCNCLNLQDIITVKLICTLFTHLSANFVMCPCVWHSCLIGMRAVMWLAGNIMTNHYTSPISIPLNWIILCISHCKYNPCAHTQYFIYIYWLLWLQC